MDKKTIKKLMTEFGKRGGKKTLEKYGVEHFKKISKLGKITLMKKLSPVELDKQVDKQ